MDAVETREIRDFLRLANLSDYQRHEHFHILNKADHQKEFPSTMSYRIHNYFELSFSPNSTTVLQIDDQDVYPGGSTLLFLSPGQSLSVSDKANYSNTSVFICHFTCDFLNLAFSEFSLIQEFPFLNLQSKPKYLLNELQNQTIGNCFVRLYEQFRDNEKCNFEIVRSRLIILLNEIRCMFLAEKLNPASLTRFEEISHQFELLIRKTSRKKQKLSDYASELCISTAYLLECVKKATGETPKKVLSKYLILEAKSLLQRPKNTMEMIADLLGFDEASNFINFFKKNAGMTPGRYRRSIQTGKSALPIMMK